MFRRESLVLDKNHPSICVEIDYRASVTWDGWMYVYLVLFDCSKLISENISLRRRLSPTLEMNSKKILPSSINTSPKIPFVGQETPSDLQPSATNCLIFKIHVFSISTFWLLWAHFSKTLRTGHMKRTVKIIRKHNKIFRRRSLFWTKPSLNLDPNLAFFEEQQWSLLWLDRYSRILLCRCEMRYAVWNSRISHSSISRTPQKQFWPWTQNTPVGISQWFIQNSKWDLIG